MYLNKIKMLMKTVQEIRDKINYMDRQLETLTKSIVNNEKKK